MSVIQIWHVCMCLHSVVKHKREYLNPCICYSNDKRNHFHNWKNKSREGQRVCSFFLLHSLEVVAETKADKETLRRKELKNIKKKYHLVGEEYKVHHDSTLHGKYQDRAEQRRQTVGSDNPYEPDSASASVNR